MSANTVRAGNMLNELIGGDAPFAARAAVWIAYYPLMRALGVVLDRFERTIHKQYEPVKLREPPLGWERDVTVE